MDIMIYIIKYDMFLIKKQKQKIMYTIFFLQQKLVYNTRMSKNEPKNESVVP